MIPKTQYIKMKVFMLENNIGINSKHDLFRWAEIVAKENKGKCPCNPKTRPECPCPQALEEINLKGYCDCKLFGNNNACNDCDKECKIQFIYFKD